MIHSLAVSGATYTSLSFTGQNKPVTHRKVVYCRVLIGPYTRGKFSKIHIAAANVLKPEAWTLRPMNGPATSSVRANPCASAKITGDGKFSN